MKDRILYVSHFQMGNSTWTAITRISPGGQQMGRYGQYRDITEASFNRLWKVVVHARMDVHPFALHRMPGWQAWPRR